MKTDLEAATPVLGAGDAQTILRASKRGIMLHSIQVVDDHAVYVQSTGAPPNYLGECRVVNGRNADPWFDQITPAIPSGQFRTERFSLVDGIPAYVGFSHQAIGPQYVLVVGQCMTPIDAFSIGHLIKGKLHVAFKTVDGPWQIMRNEEVLHETRNPILNFGYDEDGNLIILVSDNGTERLIAWGLQFDKVQRLLVKCDPNGHVISIHGERDGQSLTWAKGEEPKWESSLLILSRDIASLA